MFLRVLHIVPSTPFARLQRIAALVSAEERRFGLDVHQLPGHVRDREAFCLALTLHFLRQRRNPSV